MRWRPVGLGLMGLQDVFFQMRLPVRLRRGAARSRGRISEEVYFHALGLRRAGAARRARTRPFAETRTARGELQFDAWGVVPERRGALGARCASASREHGLRNSLLVAIAPTATIASIAGCYECIEPQVSNLFKRETLSGDFLQVNRYLVDELKQLGLWTDATRSRLKLAEGSVQAHRGAARRAPRSSTGRRGRSRCARSSTWPPTAAPSSTRASRSTCSSRTPTSASSRPCTSTPGRRGLKTTYYLRSRPATRIAKATVEAAPVRAPSSVDAAPASAADVSAAGGGSRGRRCSLENPETLRGLPVRPRRTSQPPASIPGLCLDPAPDGVSGASSRCTAPPSRTRGRSRRSTSRPTSAISLAR